MSAVRLNSTQKIGLFIGVALCGVVVFLHNPLGRYLTDCYHVSGNSDIWKDCYMKGGLPMLEWVSTDAFVPFLATIGHALSAAVFVALLTLFWVYLFRDTKREI